MAVTRNTIRAFVSEMKPGQIFSFSRQSLNDSIVWQKKGTRTVSRINQNTGAVLATYYFTKEDFGYFIVNEEIVK